MFEAQAENCDTRSPLYARLCRRFADDPVAGELVGPDPNWEMPLRLLGGLHYLVLGGEAAWDDSLEEHREFLAEFVVGRSKVSLMVLDDGGGVFMRSLGHDDI